jgi:hypothetical protein
MLATLKYRIVTPSALRGTRMSADADNVEHAIDDGVKPEHFCGP